MLTFFLATIVATTTNVAPVPPPRCQGFQTAFRIISAIFVALPVKARAFEVCEYAMNPATVLAWLLLNITVGE